ncbi:hybrid sensor histidine kinase/response regulator [Spirulina major]|uniref:hybrid sensor histidine kinase/response regulator n=1 Tax=Spirulina major TaxID=270636 RepID=UPI0009FBD75C|nr:hybrid sensor histidine kinase/response regulator [Spirulina major]
MMTPITLDSPSNPSPTLDLLIVDDTPANLRLLSDMLQGQGYGVRKAINGKMALLAVKSLLPDLILLDINLPDMTGYQVCQQLKADPQTAAVPIIFLSALNEAEDKVKAFQSGGEDYITKPFLLEEVLARVNHQLQLAQLHQQLATQNETLKTTNGQLENTLLELQKTQAQVIQQEKLAGLAQLVAGLAHEVNNPVGFIAGNLEPVADYAGLLIEAIARYQAELPNPSPSLQDFLEEMDLEFIQADLPQVLQSMRSGTERLRSLILALRIFAHLDESDVKTINIAEAIDTTLMLVNQRLQADPPIQVVKHYKHIPNLVCYARKFNQVILSLITNAIDALRAKTDQTAPTLTLGIDATETGFTITVQDNGVGMDAAARSHIFEPFFTTKPIGSGQGLGLATSYQIIVEDHHGDLQIHSEPGQGTTVIIQLPTEGLKDT